MLAPRSNSLSAAERQALASVRSKARESVLDRRSDLRASFGGEIVTGTQFCAGLAACGVKLSDAEREVAFRKFADFRGDVDTEKFIRFLEVEPPANYEDPDQRRPTLPEPLQAVSDVLEDEVLDNAWEMIAQRNPSAARVPIASDEARAPALKALDAAFQSAFPAAEATTCSASVPGFAVAGTEDGRVAVLAADLFVEETVFESAVEYIACAAAADGALLIMASCLVRSEAGDDSDARDEAASVAAQLLLLSRSESEIQLLGAPIVLPVSRLAALWLNGHDFMVTRHATLCTLDETEEQIDNNDDTVERKQSVSFFELLHVEDSSVATGTESVLGRPLQEEAEDDNGDNESQEPGDALPIAPGVHLTTLGEPQTLPQTLHQELLGLLVRDKQLMQLALASQGCSFVYLLQNKAELQKVPLPGAVRCLTMLDRYNAAPLAAFGLQSGCVAVWALGSAPRPVATLRHHVSPATAVALLPAGAGADVLCGCEDGGVRAFRLTQLQQGQSLATLFDGGEFVAEFWCPARSDGERPSVKSFTRAPDAVGAVLCLSQWADDGGAQALLLDAIDKRFVGDLRVPSASLCAAISTAGAAVGAAAFPAAQWTALLAESALTPPPAPLGRETPVSDSSSDGTRLLTLQPSSSQSTIRTGISGAHSAASQQQVKRVPVRRAAELLPPEDVLGDQTSLEAWRTQTRADRDAWFKHKLAQWTR